MTGGASNPRAGAHFERRVAATLTLDGYLVMRSAGSRGAIDLIALKPGQVLLIQCKINARLDTDAWNLLRHIALQAGGTPLLVSRGERNAIVWSELRDAARAGHRKVLTVWQPDIPDAPTRAERLSLRAAHGGSGR